MIKTDYTPDLLPDDEVFEFVITEAITGTSSRKETPFIQVKLKVRDDVEQEHQNHVLVDRFYQIDGEYNKRKVNGIAKAVGIPEGTVFDTEEDYCEAIQGGLVRAFIKQEYDDFRGEDRNVVVYYMSTENPHQELGESEEKSSDPKTKQSTTKKQTDDIPDVEDMEEDDLGW